MKYTCNFSHNKSSHIYLNLKLGDIVRVIDYGDRYSAYESAEKFFKVHNNPKVIGTRYQGSINLNDAKFKENWVVLGMGLHSVLNGSYPARYDVVLCLGNRYRDILIINIDGVAKRRKYLHSLEKFFIPKNRGHVINQIPTNN